MNWRFWNRLTFAIGCASPFLTAAYIFGFRNGWVEAIKWLATVRGP